MTFYGPLNYQVYNSNPETSFTSSKITVLSSYLTVKVWFTYIGSLPAEPITAYNLAKVGFNGNTQMNLSPKIVNIVDFPSVNAEVVSIYFENTFGSVHDSSLKQAYFKSVELSLDPGLFTGGLITSAWELVSGSLEVI